MTEQTRCLSSLELENVIINNELFYCNSSNFQNVKGFHASYMLLSLLYDKKNNKNHKEYILTNKEKIIDLLNKFSIEIALYSGVSIIYIENLLNSLINYEKVDFDINNFIDLYKEIIKKLLKGNNYNDQNFKAGYVKDYISNFADSSLNNIIEYNNLCKNLNILDIDNKKSLMFINNYEYYNNNIFKNINKEKICINNFDFIDKSFKTFISNLNIINNDLKNINKQYEQNIRDSGLAPEVYLKIKDEIEDKCYDISDSINNCNDKNLNTPLNSKQVCMQLSTCSIDKNPSKKMITIKSEKMEEYENFHYFSDIIDNTQNNKDIFNKISIHINDDEPSNVILFGYGYSGAGKTYTLMGNKEDDKGLLRQIINEIKTRNRKIELINVFELYKNNFYDISDNSYNTSFKSEEGIKNPTHNDFNNNFNGKIIKLIIQEKDNKYNIVDEESLNCNPNNINNFINKEYIKYNINVDENNIDKILKTIETHRKIKKRIKYTINNPQSSRSHLFITFRYYINKKNISYFTIVDMGGSENPLNIYNNLMESTGMNISTIFNSLFSINELRKRYGNESFNIKFITNKNIKYKSGKTENINIINIDLLLEIVNYTSEYIGEDLKKINDYIINTKTKIFKLIQDNIITTEKKFSVDFISHLKNKKEDTNTIKEEYDKNLKLLNDFKNISISDYLKLDLKLYFNAIIYFINSHKQRQEEINKFFIKIYNGIKKLTEFKYLCLLYIKETVTEGFYINETINHIKWFLLNKTDYGKEKIKNECNINNYTTINKQQTVGDIIKKTTALDGTKGNTNIKFTFNDNTELNFVTNKINEYDENEDRLSKYLFSPLYTSTSKNLDEKYNFNDFLNIIYNIKSSSDNDFKNIFYFKNPSYALCNDEFLNQNNFNLLYRDPIGIITVLQNIEKYIEFPKLSSGGSIIRKPVSPEITCKLENKNKVKYIMVSCIIGSDLIKHCDNNYKTIKFSEGISVESIVSNFKSENITIDSEINSLKRISLNVKEIKECDDGPSTSGS